MSSEKKTPAPRCYCGACGAGSPEADAIIAEQNTKVEELQRQINALMSADSLPDVAELRRQLEFTRTKLAESTAREGAHITNLKELEGVVMGVLETIHLLHCAGCQAEVRRAQQG